MFFTYFNKVVSVFFQSAKNWKTDPQTGQLSRPKTTHSSEIWCKIYDHVLFKTLIIANLDKVFTHLFKARSLYIAVIAVYISRLNTWWIQDYKYFMFDLWNIMWSVTGRFHSLKEWNLWRNDDCDIKYTITFIPYFGGYNKSREIFFK